MTTSRSHVKARQWRIQVEHLSIWADSVPLHLSLVAAQGSAGTGRHQEIFTIRAIAVGFSELTGKLVPN
jgi:hypothetical protein